MLKSPHSTTVIIYPIAQISQKKTFTKKLHSHIINLNQD